MTTQALVFQNTTFTPVDRNNQPWLKATEIAQALGYANEYAVSKIFNRNKDEFTEAMTETVNLGVSGNLQNEVRIFSLRGAHLIGMFARTKLAKEFRVWVLDILDQHTATPTEIIPALPSPATISPALLEHINRKANAVTLRQYDTIKAIITEAVQSNLNCGAPEASAHEYIETYGELASNVTIINNRDLFMLASQTTSLLNSAGQALETIHRLESHLGRQLYLRKKHGEFGCYGLPESLVENVLRSANQRTRRNARSSPR